jgi:hypothetical protein
MGRIHFALWDGCEHLEVGRGMSAIKWIWTIPQRSMYWRLGPHLQHNKKMVEYLEVDSSGRKLDHWGEMPLKKMLETLLFCVSLFLSWLPWVLNHVLPQDRLCQHRSRQLGNVTMNWNHETKETVHPFKLIISGILSQWWEIQLTHTMMFFHFLNSMTSCYFLSVDLMSFKNSLRVDFLKIN